MSGLSRQLQGTTIDIIQGYDFVNEVKEVVSQARRNDVDFESVYLKSQEMAKVANITLAIPRRCARQTERSNVTADNLQEYLKRSVFIPFVDSLIQQFGMRFNDLSKASIRGMYLMPSNLHFLNQECINSLLSYYKSDLPSPNIFPQEVKLWKRQWSSVGVDMSDCISSVLSDKRSSILLYPNVTKILFLILLTSITSSGVERANSLLKYVKRSSCSTMKDDRFNALLLLYIHKDIELDISKIVELYAKKHPGRMVLLNPLSNSNA